MPFGFIDGDSGSSPEDLFRMLPPVSKAIICFMIGSVLTVVLGIFTPMNYALVWPFVWNKFHVWRIVTCGLFPGTPNFHTLTHVFAMGMYSIWYEKDGFNMGGGGGSADFAFMLMFGFAVIETIHLTLFYAQYFIVSKAVLFYVIYVWSRKNPTMSVRFWGVSINAVYVPWVMVFIDLLIGDYLFYPLFGIAVGHLFYFLVDILPDLHDIDLLRTPEFLVRLLGFGVPGSGVERVAPGQHNSAGLPAPGVVRPPRDIPRAGGRASGWGSRGTGRTLGSS